MLLGLTGSSGLIAQGDLLTVCPVGCQFSTIQEAVAAARSQDTITIGPGQYTGPVIITKSLKLIGSGPQLTVITSGVIVAGRANVLLEGMMLTLGLNGLEARHASVVTVRESLIAGNAANGIAAFDLAQVILANVTITKNGMIVDVAGVPHPLGGGIALKGRASLSTFNVRISESGANGISMMDQSSASLGVLTTISLSGISGILMGGAATATFNGIVVMENGCFGIAVADNSQAELIGVRVSRNAAAGIKVGGTSAVIPGCSTQIDPHVTAHATIRDSFVSENPIGILVGDLSKDFESAVVEIRTVQIEKSPVCGLLVDPAAPKEVSTFQIHWSLNAQDRC
jgi:hypothetical protein